MSIAALLYFYFQVDVHLALINAVPFAVISSAVAIPSSVGLAKSDREFIIYESSFSDIIGIMLFNFLVSSNNFSFNGVLFFGTNILITIVIAAAVSLALVYYLDKIKHHVKFLPIFAVLLIIYSIAKIYHFSPLVIVLVFGLALNNTHLFIKGKFEKNFDTADLKLDLIHFKMIAAESVFFMRTFFFLLFGFSIDVDSLFNFDNLILSFAIVVLILIIRFFGLYTITKEKLKKVMFFSPRGLITVLLFLNIPQELRIPYITECVVIMVVLISIFTMVVGLWSQGKEFVEEHI